MVALIVARNHVTGEYVVIIARKVKNYIKNHIYYRLKKDFGINIVERRHRLAMEFYLFFLIF